MRYLAVGIGGMAGSTLRYIISYCFMYVPPGNFPYGTLVVNLLGCFLLGWLTGAVHGGKKYHPYVLPGFGAGLIGSFTTFSTFSAEMVELLLANAVVKAFIYMMTSAVIGIVSVWMGYSLGIRKYGVKKS